MTYGRYSTNDILIKRYTEEELRTAIDESVKRGYRLVDQGCQRREYSKFGSTTHWAKMERENKATP